MSIFWGREFVFVFPIYVQKYTIDRWIVVYTVCASAVISPWRQWLDSYTKIRLKCVTCSSILFICNTFCCWLILLSSLYIELALVCCTDPENVPGGPYPRQPDQYRSYLSKNDARWLLGPWTGLWHGVREMTWYLYTIGVCWRMKAKQRWFKVTRELCHEWFHVRYYVHDGHWTGEFAPVIWRIHCFTVSFTRLSQLENSAMGTWPIYKYYYTRLVRKMAWYEILMHVLIV